MLKINRLDIPREKRLSGKDNVQYMLKHMATNKNKNNSY